MELARKNGSKDPLTDTIGTKHYWSPEIKKKEVYTAKTDIFAFGLVAIEVFVGNGKKAA